MQKPASAHAIQWNSAPTDSGDSRLCVHALLGANTMASSNRVHGSNRSGRKGGGGRARLQQSAWRCVWEQPQERQGSLSRREVCSSGGRVCVMNLSMHL